MSSPAPEGVDLLSSPVRRTIVDYIANQRGEDGITAAELSEILNLHVTTARFHLDQLVTGGLLDAEFVRQGVGRPRKVYSIAPGELRGDVENHAMQLLSQLLVDSFGASADGDQLTPFEAGRRWAEQHVPAEGTEPATTPGTWLAKIGRLIDVLRDWGYTPFLSTTDAGRTAQLELAHCPFIGLAKSNPAVVCGIHRGLIAGTLEQFGEDDAEVSLEPFVGPEHCLAHVTTHNPFSRVSRRPATPVPLPTKYNDPPTHESTSKEPA